MQKNLPFEAYILGSLVSLALPQEFALTVLGIAITIWLLYNLIT